MSYTTQQDILDFVEDNNVKFVRFAFCDIFGFQKNIAVLASDLPKALEDGVCFDGSAIAGFMHVEESDLVLRPDLSTMTILPWRTAEGRVMQFFCDVEKPDNTPLSVDLCFSTFSVIPVKYSLFVFFIALLTSVP